MTLRVLPCGERAVLVELDDLDHVLGLQRALAAATPPGVQEWVPAARTVLVRFDPSVTTPARLADALAALPPSSAAMVTGPLVELEVRYDGADLAGVAAFAGCDADEVVARHVAPTYTVAFCGFTPS